MSLDAKVISIVEKLPFKVQDLEIFELNRPEGFQFSEHIISIRGKISGHEILACGEAQDEATAQAKAISEFVERATLVTFGKLLGARTSNGWSAHPNAEAARSSAICELVERDAVLAHWYLKRPFREINRDELPESIQSWCKNELATAEFPILRVLVSDIGLGPSVSCFLLNERGYGVCSHATRFDLDDAIESAISEACRGAHKAIRKAHWGESLKLKENVAGRVSPSSHNLFYAYHEPFPAWVFGEKISYQVARQEWDVRLSSVNQNKGFKYTSVLEYPIKVGFATHKEALEIFWGVDEVLVRRNISKIEERFGRLENEINLCPHFVS